MDKYPTKRFSSFAGAFGFKPKEDQEETQDGQHRKADKTDQGDPADGANSSTGGASANNPISAGAQNATAQFAAAQQAGASQNNMNTFINAIGLAYTTPLAALNYQNTIMQMQQIQHMQQNARRLSKPPHDPIKLRSETIVAGEIIAWRAWIIYETFSRQSYSDPSLNKSSGHVLKAMAAGVDWKPGEVMLGDAAGGYGIHAFKSKALLWREYGKYIATLGRYDVSTDSTIEIAWGEVALWEDVIEHEDGYRASHAKIHSLAFTNFEEEAELRKTYGVGAPSE